MFGRIVFILIHLFIEDLFLIICMYVCLFGVCASTFRCLRRPGGGSQDPLALELQVNKSYLMWILEYEFKSSARTQHTLNRRAISFAPIYLFLLHLFYLYVYVYEGASAMAHT